MNVDRGDKLNLTECMMAWNEKWRSIGGIDGSKQIM
jgi:hypothetical protein